MLTEEPESTKVCRAGSIWLSIRCICWIRFLSSQYVSLGRISLLSNDRLPSEEPTIGGRGRDSSTLWGNESRRTGWGCCRRFSSSLSRSMRSRSSRARSLSALNHSNFSLSSFILSNRIFSFSLSNLILSSLSSTFKNSSRRRSSLNLRSLSWKVLSKSGRLKGKWGRNPPRVRPPLWKPRMLKAVGKGRRKGMGRLNGGIMFRRGIIGRSLIGALIGFLFSLNFVSNPLAESLSETDLFVDFSSDFLLFNSSFLSSLFASLSLVLLSVALPLNLTSFLGTVVLLRTMLTLEELSWGRF